MQSRLNEANNRLTNMIDTLGTTRYAYDRVSQFLSEDGPWDSGKPKQWGRKKNVE